jgi:hypothetical protein
MSCCIQFRAMLLAVVETQRKTTVTRSARNGKASGGIHTTGQ